MHESVLLSPVYVARAYSDEGGRMRILITGSRTWPNRDTVHVALFEFITNDLGILPPVDGLTDITMVHGHCPKGVDAWADEFYTEYMADYGAKIERHPAKWDQFGKRAGPIRNQEMVDLGADVCLAFPTEDGRGTQDCVKRAMAAGIKVKVHKP